MNVQHTGPEPVYLPAVGDWVEPRQTVEVTDEVAASLVDQGWFQAGGVVPGPKSKRTLRVKAGESIDPPNTSEEG